ncbi:MAG TPA: hypothetical protein VLE70_09360 [Anaerolineae bacterium]|jgi:hypothetical protein|nr:hypothetical protein [Anaerolineae bacterium]
MAGKTPETHYNGENFRSRLAARWAVFFHTAGIDYLYETQPFDLGDGLAFLPDFYLKRGVRFLGEEKPRGDVWVAVQPDAQLAEDDRQRVLSFVTQTGKNILLIAGDPGLEAEVLFIRRAEQMGLDAAEVSFIELADGRAGLVDEREKARLDRDEDRALVDSSKQTALLRKAYRAARENRFDRRMKLPESGLDVDSLLRAVSPAQRRIVVSLFVVALVGLCALSAIQATGLPGAMLDLLDPAVQPTATPPLPATYTPIPTAAVTMDGLAPGLAGTRSICSCSADLYQCADFASQEQAQACFDFCSSFMGDIHRLDDDGDGRVCLTSTE